MKKLIEALHVIQDECDKHPNACNDDCPFYYHDRGCAIAVKPELWKINDVPQKALL